MFCSVKRCAYEMKDSHDNQAEQAASKTSETRAKTLKSCQLAKESQNHAKFRRKSSCKLEEAGCLEHEVKVQSFNHT